MDDDDGMMLNIVSIEAPKKKKKLGKIRTATPSFKQLRTGDFKGMAHLKHEAKVMLREKNEKKQAAAEEEKALENGSSAVKKTEVKDVEMKEKNQEVKPVATTKAPTKKRAAEEITNAEQESDQPPQKKRKTEEVKPEITKEGDKTESPIEEKPAPKADHTKKGSVPQRKVASVPNPANFEFAPKSLSRLKQDGKSLNKKQLLERTKKVVSTESLFSEKTFADLNLDARLVKNLEEVMSMPKPTLIQKAAVPAILSKHDALVQAETGSGKTLTYLLPIIQDLVSERLSRTAGTAAIIIAPTRELSLQIFDVLTKLLKPYHWIVPGILIGGEKRKSEKARIRKGLNVVVATPGRLLDHLKQTNCFNIAPLRWLILDEADRLLDLGFERDLSAIIHTLNSRSTKVPVAGKSTDDDDKKSKEDEEVKPNEHKSRQTVLCSATLNKDVDRLAIMSLIDPLFISLDDLRKKQDETGSDKNENEEKDNDNEDENDEDREEKEFDEEFKSFSLPSGLQQHSVTVHPKWRHVTLAAFIRQQAIENPKVKIIVFMSTSDEVEFYYTIFGSIQIPKIPAYKVKSNRDLPMEELIPIPMFKLYGDLSQEVRRSTYLKFCEIPSGVLFCTDVAARGLDMPNISWIVQYDVPSDPKSYIHRIGRTARIGQSGDALLFLLPSERPYVDILKTKLNMQFNELSVDDIMAKLKVNIERNVSNDPLVEAASLQHLIESTVEEGKEEDTKTMAAKAYQSFIRSYATHTKVTKEIFHVKNLHLGHIAKSFGLKDPPSVVGRAMSKQRKKIDGRKQVAKGVRMQKSQSIKRVSVLDEFAA